jgi:hypothetical protein
MATSRAFAVDPSWQTRRCRVDRNGGDRRVPRVRSTRGGRGTEARAGGWSGARGQGPLRAAPTGSQGQRGGGGSGSMEDGSVWVAAEPKSPMGNETTPQDVGGPWEKSPAETNRARAREAARGWLGYGIIISYPEYKI